MLWPDRILLRVRALFQRGRFEGEMDEELRFHLESQIEDHIKRGMNPDEARRAALLHFGGVDKTKEECRDTRWTRFPENLWQDLRHGFRTLHNDRGYTLAALLTLTLGIGANIAIFSIVNGVLLRPLPYDKPDELFVFVALDEGRKDLDLDATSPPFYRAWRERNTVFQEIGLFTTEPMDLTGEGEPERLNACYATSATFGVLRVKASYGRIFDAQEDTPGAARVVILSDGFWKRRFGGDKNVLGKTIRLSDRLYTVLGIMPLGFRFPNEDTDLWAPYNVELAEVFNATTARFAGNNLVARLKPGVSRKQAEDNINGIVSQLRIEYPKTTDKPDKRLMPLHEHIVGKVRPALLILLGAVGFVLLVVCSNVANLALMRSEARRREMAIRVALGASTCRLIQHSLTESALLSLAGGGLGLLLASWIGRALVRMAPVQIPRLGEIGMDGRMVAFLLTAAAFSTLFAGLLPALRASRPDVSETIKEGGSASPGASSRSTARKLFVVCELALALILLAGAGLMIRSVLHLLRLDLGFDASNVLTMRLARPLSKGYKEGWKVESQRRMALFHQLIERIKGLPGVQSVGATTTLPLRPTILLMITADKQSNAPRELELWTDPYWVVPDYFAAMGIPILRGRAFNSADGVKPPSVVIIDATMARRFWPGEDAIGKRLKQGFHDDPNEWLTVVGIVPHVQKNQLGVQDLGWFAHTEQVYFPETEEVSMCFAIRTRVDPLSLVEAVRREVWKLDKNQPVSDVAAMESLVSAFTAEPRFYMYLLSTFAALALILGAMGIYGVTSYWVAQRTHEIGVRMALGAQSKDVLRMVLRQSVVMTAVGLALGIGGALALTRFLTGMIYGLTANDPAAFASVSALLAIVAVAASFIPARRATEVDPMVALRYE